MDRCDRCGKWLTMTADVYSGCGNPEDCSCRYCAACASHKYPDTNAPIERRAEYSEADAMWDAR